MKQVPVYLFNGFLECGKTRFIQETMEDERFGVDEKTLVIVCEEGELDYNPSRFSVKEYKLVRLDEDEFNQKTLNELDKEFKPDTIMLEYNGMWTNETLFNALPENWVINQVMTFFDSSTFNIFNQNMRQQTFEKISIADLVVFNRMTTESDKINFHKAVRAITRRCDILYEWTNGQVDRDDIIDPLPYDINACPIVIENKDFAYFYRDICEETEKYNGKRIKFVGQVALSKNMPENCFLIGRHIMTCCEADIAYSPLVAVGKNKVEHMDWIELTATISIEKHKIYKGFGPVLKIDNIEKTEKPEENFATFY